MLNSLKKLQSTWHPYLQPLLRIVLGFIFLQSGYAKLQHLPEFYEAARNYHVLPPAVSHFYAVMVPWLEIMAGIYLFFGLFTRFAALISSGLLVSFIIAIAVVLSRGEAINCGCFVGGKESPVDMALLIRDVLLLAASSYLLFTKPCPYSMDGYLSRPELSDSESLPTEA